MKYSYVNKEPHEIFQDILDGKIGRFPANYWKQSGVEEVASSITRYFIEVVLGWNDVEIKNINEKVFRQYRLSGMLEYVFDRSPFRAINNAYLVNINLGNYTVSQKDFGKKKIIGQKLYVTY